MRDELIEEAIQANKRSFKRAFETAVRTQTALIFMQNDKLAEVHSPYRYELIPIRQPEENL